MKKTLSLLVFLLAITFQVQSQVYSWAKGIHDNFGKILAVSYDNSGNVYSTGQFVDSADFNPGSGIYMHSAAGGRGNAFVLKQDAAGNFVWARFIGGVGATGGAEAQCIKIDRLGNIVLGGNFVGTVDFDPGSGTHTVAARSGGSNTDGFVLKLDPAGNFLWARTLGSNRYDYVVALSIDTGNNILATGTFQDTADFNIGGSAYNLTVFGWADIYVEKISPSGSLIWVKQMGGNVIDQGLAICTDEVNNVYTTGIFGGHADFDPGAGVYNLTSSGANQEVFVSKLDSNGNFIWARQVNGNYSNIAWGITVDRCHNVYTAGSFIGTADFDPGTATYYMVNHSTGSTSDAFVFKLDVSGNFVWAKQIGGGSASSAQTAAMALDSLNNVYIVGNFTDTVDFDPGTGVYNLVPVDTSGAKRDMYVFSCDSMGNFRSTIKIGGQSAEIMQSVAVSKDGTSIYVVGEIYDTVDFDLGTGTALLTGPCTMVIARYSQCTVPFTPTVTITSCLGTTITTGTTDTFFATVFGGGTSPSYQWYVNGIAVSGATSSIFYPSSLHDNDSVTCHIISSDTCVTTSYANSNLIVIHVVPSIINVLSAVGNLLVYPNPSDGAFAIELRDRRTNKEVLVKVKDVLGRQVYQRTLDASGIDRVQLRSDIPDGVYLLQLSSEDSVVTSRVSVTR